MTEANNLATSNLVLTGKQVLMGSASFAGVLALGAWAIVSHTLGSVTDDVADIRAQIIEGRSVSREISGENRRAEGELREQLTELIAQLREANTALTGLTGNLSNLDRSIVKLDERLAASVSRQQNFEKWVVAKLGSVDSVPSVSDGMVIQESWQGSQVDIVDKIYDGTDPLAMWFKSLDAGQ